MCKIATQVRISLSQERGLDKKWTLQSTLIDTISWCKKLGPGGSGILGTT